MPLKKGKKNAGKNIAEMERAGYPPAQAVAAGLRAAAGKKKSGKKKRRGAGPAATGGAIVPTVAVQQWAKNQARAYKARGFRPAPPLRG